MARIGFIGLGTMGGPMARNLLAAGHELFFYSRREEVATSFTQAGAQVCASCAEAAASADFIITIVSADEDVRQVVLGDEGIVAAAAGGKLLIEMSTISPQTVREVGQRLREAGMAMLDAPVSGGPTGAAKGTLTIMVGGDADDFENARDLLEILGHRLFHLGPLGAGQTVKLVNQLLAGGVMTLVGEALNAAQRAGLDLTQAVQAIEASSGNSKVFKARAPFVLENRFQPAFRLDLMRKDMALAVELAERLGVSAPVALAALQRYDLAIQDGLAASDFSAVAKFESRL